MRQMIDIEAPDRDDWATVRAWIGGHLAADVASIAVTTFDVKVGLTNGVTVDLPRVDPRLMADLERAVSIARRQAPPQRLRPLRQGGVPAAEGDEDPSEP